MSTKLHLVTTLVCVLIAYISAKDSACYKPQISLTQKIEHEGFHREFHWLLERTPNSLWDETSCKVALMLKASKEMYFNPDQIADLNRNGLLSARVEGSVDVEAVAHLAQEHFLYIYVTNSSDRIKIDVPFHLRYQRAQIAGGFGKVPINRPTLLMQCPNLCENAVDKLKIEAPCDYRDKNQCVWSNVSYQVLFDNIELLVPVGNLDDYPIVSVVTLLLGCAGCIYTLSLLSTTPL